MKMKAQFEFQYPRGFDSGFGLAIGAREWNEGGAEKNFAAEPQCNVACQLPDGSAARLRAEPAVERARREAAADGAKSAQSPAATGAHVGHGG